MRRFALALLAAALPLACDDGRFSSSFAGGGGGAGGGAPCTPDGDCLIAFTYPLGNAKSVVLRGDFAPDGWTVGVPMLIEGTSFRTVLSVPNGGLVHYKFLIDGATWVADPTNPWKEPDGFGAENSVKKASCEVVTCPAGGAGGAGGGGGAGNAGGGGGGLPGAFDWRSAVLYFVFVDRFKNGDPSNDDPIPMVESKANYQGGDWAGLKDVIESGYFESLGVNALWLTVPMDNPSVSGPGSDGHAYSAYHGYWPSDLQKTEEHFGDLALLKQVVDAAHAHGLKVLIDYAMNHVHASAPVYAQHPEWFWPLDYNGNQCVCGGGCSWDDAYEQKRCWFRDYLPDWNFTLPAARAYSVDNAIQWVKDTGIDGFRLDAVKHIETEWISELRQRVTDEIESQSGEHFYMVGETFESGNRDAIKKFVSPTLLDGQFDFPLRGLVVERILRRTGSMSELDSFLASNDGYYPGVMSTFIGNHDLARVLQTALDQPWEAWSAGSTDQIWFNSPGLPDYKAPFERLGVAFTFLFTTKGIPLVYYGDEIGMPGAGDPDNRRFMQWDGLSDDQLWLREHLAKLGALRRDHPVLWRGTRTPVSTGWDTYVYKLDDGQESIWVALNRGDQAQQVQGLPSQGTDLLQNQDVAGPAATLQPRSALVVVAK